MSMAAGREFHERIAETEDPVVFDVDSEIGSHYIAAMELAGRYAYAGREYVIAQVLDILGAKAVETVHNHHNFAWFEDDHWVVRDPRDSL
jgi:tRNA-splicing ligase RtcB